MSLSSFFYTRPFVDKKGLIAYHGPETEEGTYLAKEEAIEVEGVVKESKSNKTFFVAEHKKGEKEE